MASFVGIDIGTSGAKTTLVTVIDDVAVEERSAVVPYGSDNEPCRDPVRWVSACIEALADLQLTSDDGLAGVGFTGQMHALVTTDEDLRPLRPALLWLDYQGGADLDSFVRDHSEIDVLRRTGNLPLPDFTLAKWLYARASSPGLRSAVRAVIGAKDYVRTCLCGGSLLTDVNEAAGTQLYDPFTRRWDPEVLAAAGLSEAALPQAVESTSRVPGLNALPHVYKGVPAVVGTGDQAAASRGVGGLEPGVVSLSLGTSGVAAVRFHLDELPAQWDGQFHLFPLDDAGDFHLIGTIPSVGPTFRWLARLTGVTPDRLPAIAKEAQSRRLDVQFFPYLGGRGAPHADTNQRGALTGLTDDTSAADIVEAVYRGIGLEFASIVAEMRAIGASVEHVVCSGGVAVDSHLVETVAACLDTPCSIAIGGNASSSGAALLAADAFSEGSQVRLGWRAVHSYDAPDGAERWQDQRQAITGSSLRPDCP